MPRNPGSRRQERSGVSSINLLKRKLKVRYDGPGKYAEFVFNRLALIEMLEEIRQMLGVTRKEAEVGKCVDDAILLIAASDGDFVWLDKRECELMGIPIWMAKLRALQQGKKRVVTS